MSRRFGLAVSMAETKCAKWRRESVPVELREKGREALASCLTDLVFGVVVSIAGCFRGRRVTGSALSLLGCREPEAFTVHLQDMDMMGEARANFLTPVPHAASFDALNAALEERCCARQAERAGRHEQTIGERLIADQAVLRALPELPFEPCDKRPAKVSSTALVRYRMNDYSAPTAYGFRDVLVKGFVDEVAIICGASEIARHPRVYGRGQFVFDPKHYLALLEQKPGALDQAAPLQNWTLPEPLQHLRRLLEARMGNRGKREFIQALRLIEVFPETLVAAAALDAIRLGAISFDAIKQLVIAKVEHRPANLDLGHYPYLPAANVKTTSAADYMVLVSGRAA